MSDHYLYDEHGSYVGRISDRPSGGSTYSPDMSYREMELIHERERENAKQFDELNIARAKSELEAAKASGDELRILQAQRRLQSQIAYSKQHLKDVDRHYRFWARDKFEHGFDNVMGKVVTVIMIVVALSIISSCMH